jgi:hypothetical protein
MRECDERNLYPLGGRNGVEALHSFATFGARRKLKDCFLVIDIRHPQYFAVLSFGIV